MAVKRKQGERLDPEYVEQVIKHLEDGGTKKDAYDILNIKANPSRLQKIIDEYNQRVETEKRIRKQKRGTGPTNLEIQEIISGALDGTAIKAIADGLFRSTTFVNNVIDSVGIPRKMPGDWWQRRYESSIPDQCVSEDFEMNEIVWSNKYNGLAFIRGSKNKSSYPIYVIEKIEHEAPFAIGGKVYTGYGGFHANQPAAELGSLSHLKKYGVDLYKPYKSYFPKWLN